jgi:hypothetical protein
MFQLNLCVIHHNPTIPAHSGIKKRTFSIQILTQPTDTVFMWGIGGDISETGGIASGSSRIAPP